MSATPSTNFDLAPPPVMVDGLLAVPIDIQHVAASLVFDGATSSVAGDATIEFVMGPAAGNPIFDLRQTITAAWLDGGSIPIGQCAHHDFGGGPNAEVRVAQSVLPAGSAHTLRLTYDVGLPQASMAGAYLPAITWSSGPRLAFNFGFTDLGAGRYLEAWIPANLIFDQFSMDLEIQVMNTAVSHTIITNGTVTALASNHWSVTFPERFTALSPLLEVRATDTLVGQTGSTTLPVSGATVTIEVWKLVSSVVDLGSAIANIATWLAANESSTGPYLHGNRFVAFLIAGGMEYEGGVTATTGSLRHETFHSWWARGVKPAGQPDGWFDEAWTVYNDLGATGTLPLDFTDPPVDLCPRNPWVRVTAGAAYTTGERVFEGVASLMGAAGLRSAMAEFYGQNADRPVTTGAIEASLVARSGQADIVDAYHRFVYGLADPSPAPDLWMRDDPGDTGAGAWGGRFWDSPDLWIRNADDGGATHQPPEYGQDNWIYARVSNRSASATARHFMVTFNIKPWAGTEFVYPGDFLPAIAAAAGFDLQPGDSTVVRARWRAAQVPAPGVHACLLAALIARSDHPAAGLHVWEHNNLAQKNLTIVNLLRDEWLVLPFVINRFRLAEAQAFSMELVRPRGAEKLEAALLHNSTETFTGTLGTGVAPSPRPTPLIEIEAPLSSVHEVAVSAAERFGAEREHAVVARPKLDCGGGSVVVPRDGGAMWTSATPEVNATRLFEHAVEASFPAGRVSKLTVSAPAAQQLVLGLRVHVPTSASPGDILAMDLVQRDMVTERVIGGLAIEIHVRADGEGDE